MRSGTGASVRAVAGLEGGITVKGGRSDHAEVRFAAAITQGQVSGLAKCQSGGPAVGGEIFLAPRGNPPFGVRAQKVPRCVLALY